MHVSQKHNNYILHAHRVAVKIEIVFEVVNALSKRQFSNFPNDEKHGHVKQDKAGKKNTVEPSTIQASKSRT